MSLLTEFSDHLTQLPLVGASEEVRSGLAARRIHTHIERTVFGETEAAGGIVNLRRGDTEIEQHATDGPAATALGDHSRQLRKVRVHELETWLVMKSLMACRNSLRIPIEREHAARGTNRLQQTRCVTTPTESPIDIKTARGRGQNLQHLVDKHRYVLIHRSSPPPPQKIACTRCVRADPGVTASPLFATAVARRSQRQRLELRRQIGGGFLALDPEVATLVPARFIPEFKSITLADQHRVPRQTGVFTQFGRQ